MTVTERRAGAGTLDETRAPQSAGLVVAALAGFAALLVVFWFSWPAGVVVGLVLGVFATLWIGFRVQHAARTVPLTTSLVEEDDLRQEFRRLRVRLGDDWHAFGRAAVAVTRAQAGSAALLQRELRLPLAQAQHMLALLEREGFVGPARGTQPRHVRVSRDDTARLEALLGA